MSDSQGQRRGGNPPEEYRYRKGETGNRKGRPKGSKNKKSLFEQELKRRITVEQNGRRRRVRKGEALVTGIVNDAIIGKDRSRDTTLRAWDEIDRENAERAVIQLRDEDQAILDRYIEREIARRARLDGEGEQS